MIKLTALLLVLFVTLFSAIFLLGLSNKKSKNRLFLGYFFLISFLVFLGNFLAFFNFWKVAQFYDFIFLTALLAFYPSYYLYLFSAFNFKITSTKWMYHFIPSVSVGLIMLIVSIIAKSTDFQIYMNNNIYGTPLTTKTATALNFIYDSGRVIHLIQITVYTFLAIRLILIGRKSMANSFSNLDKYQLRYFYTTTIAFITLMSIPGFYITLMSRIQFYNHEISLLFLAVMFTFLYIILAIVGLKQIPTEIHLNNSKHQHIHLDELSAIEHKLLKYFRTKKPWLNPNLSIWDVAKYIGTNRSYISRIINEHLGTNFNSFVNSYRIKKAKNLLLKKPKISIIEISELSGFGSTNSFIRIFKKFENQTPSNFRKKNI